MKDILYWFGSIASIISLIIAALSAFALYRQNKNKQNKNIFLIAILISIIILSLVIFIPVYFWPQYILPKSKQFISWENKEARYNSIFQNFDSSKSDIVDKLWADPAAKYHKGERNSFVIANLIQNGENNCLLEIEFDVQGQGANITLRSMDNEPRYAKGMRSFLFKAKYRSSSNNNQPLGIKIRLYDYDNEAWGISKRGGNADYDNPDVQIYPGIEFKEYKVDFNDFNFKFEHDGNVYGGDNKLTLKRISKITFDLLPKGIHGNLLIDDLKFE